MMNQCTWLLEQAMRVTPRTLLSSNQPRPLGQGHFPMAFALSIYFVQGLCVAVCMMQQNQHRALVRWESRPRYPRASTGCYRLLTEQTTRKPQRFRSSSTKASQAVHKTSTGLMDKHTHSSSAPAVMVPRIHISKHWFCIKQQKIKPNSIDSSKQQHQAKRTFPRLIV